MATRRQFLLTAAAAGAARALSACGGGDGTPAATPVVGGTTGTQPAEGGKPTAPSTDGGKPTAPPAATGDATPPTQPVTPELPFYGVNAHLLDDYAPLPAWLSSDYVGTLADLGARVVRTNISDAVGAAGLVPFFQSFAASGIVPLVVIDQGFDLAGSYETNYQAAHALGLAIAGPLNGHCRYFECGNELDFACRVDYLARGRVNPVDAKPVDGSVPTDYRPASIEVLRGWTAGMLAGIKRVIPAAQCGYASGVAYGHVVADMLCNGKDTTGATTTTPIPLDFIGMHWYSSQNDILAAGPSTHTNQFVNVLQQLNAVTSRKPIIVSEFGAWDTDANQARYLTSQLDVWRTHRSEYNIVAALFYALFPNPANQGETAAMNWGMLQTDGITRKAAYAAYRSYTKAYPV
ncbi:glycoside hydrolase 5 family protein [Burkholderia alba]|uniref:hypothetical protein n=1 Tax=Burkholderia alba TaxID=2683677 RepID=UPI002B0602C2|nr:hypothetical protein [Burkholderia alba]